MDDKYSFADKAILNFLYATGTTVDDNTMTEAEFYALPKNDLYIKTMEDKEKKENFTFSNEELLKQKIDKIHDKMESDKKEIFKELSKPN
jgi:hypothetical protein